MGMRMFSGGSSRNKVSGRRYMSTAEVRPHNCMSPGCTRRGESEVGYQRTVTRPHNCMSPGCTRRGETETVREFTEFEKATDKVIEQIKRGSRGDFKRIKAPSSYAPDPDPFRFTITKSYAKHGVSLLRVTYHGCTNYEGEKILLLRRDIAVVATMKSIDPHFLENSENGLIARFVPTDEGWKLGLQALHSLV